MSVSAMLSRGANGARVFNFNFSNNNIAKE
jgi:hypothetical protein